jgi:hypothetical protein
MPAGKSPFLLALPLLLSACSSASERIAVELVSPPPQNYRQAIASRAREAFPDTRGVRDTAISAPFPGRSILGASSAVCVRANALNEKTNAYTDRKISSFTFRNGEIVEIDSRFAPALCANATYEPFPELEQDYATPPPAPPVTPPRRQKKSRT